MIDHKSLLTVAFVAMTGLAASALAAPNSSVEFTADPPTGTVQGPGPYPVLFWVGSTQSGNSTVDLNISVAGGGTISGSQVATGMKQEIDAFGGGFGGSNAVLSGNQLTVANANSAAAVASAQVGLDVRKIWTGPTGPGPLPNAPLAAPQKPDAHVLYFLVKDEVNPTLPIGQAGQLHVRLQMQNNLKQIGLSLNSTDTPEMIRRNLGALLGDTDLPDGVVYDGLIELEGGLLSPRLSIADVDADIALRMSIESAEPVGFDVGSILLAPIPEPAAAAGLAGILLLATRRVREP